MAHSIRFPRRHDKADRNGRYAVRLCITKNKRRKYIALDLYADPAYWDIGTRPASNSSFCAT